MGSAETITITDCENLVELVKGYCANQNFTTGTPSAWLTQFLQAEMTMDDCEVGVHAFAASPAFANRAWRTIDHADIISAWKTVRRNTARYMTGGNVLPAPPNPDDPRAALQHQRDVYNALASGRKVPADLYSPERIAAQNRRVQALRSGAQGSEGSGLPRRQSTRDLVEAARKACANKVLPDGTVPDPPKPEPRETRSASAHEDPLKGAATLGDSLSGVFGSRAPAPGANRRGKWCGRCNQETGIAIKVRQGQQVRVPCCTPDRIAA